MRVGCPLQGKGVLLVQLIVEFEKSCPHGIKRFTIHATKEIVIPYVPTKANIDISAMPPSSPTEAPTMSRVDCQRSSF